MTDLTITAASVIASSGAIKDSGIAGETITAGMVVVKDSATKKFYKADANVASLAHALGIALNGAAAGQPLVVAKSGDITIGATLVAGTAYYLSPNVGLIGVLADVTSGSSVVLLGLAKSTTVLTLDIQYPNVTI